MQLNKREGQRPQPKHPIKQTMETVSLGSMKTMLAIINSKYQPKFGNVSYCDRCKKLRGVPLDCWFMCTVMFFFFFFEKLFVQ